MVKSSRSSISRRDPPGDLIFFEGSVCEGGYALVKARLEPTYYPPQIRYGWREPYDQQDVLIDQQDVLQPGYLRDSPAVNEPGLFRMFSELETIEDILQFVSTYGFLHDDPLRRYYLENGATDNGEAVVWWLYWIAQVRAAVRLLDGAQGKVDISAHFSRQSFRFPGSERPYVAFCSHPEFEREISMASRYFADDKEEWQAGQNLPIGFSWRDVGHDPATLEAFDRGNFRSLATAVLTDWLNEELTKPTDKTRPWLGKRVGIRPALIELDHGISLRMQPARLLDLMWLQLAQAFSGGREYRKCAADPCPRWFAVVEYGRQRRSDRIYCSAACKTRAFRDKQGKEQGRRA